MNRGRKSAVPLENQKMVYSKYENCFLNRRFPAPSNEVYSKISKELNLKMNPKSIYKSLKKNYDYFFDKKGDSATEQQYEECIEELDKVNTSSSGSDIKDETLSHEYFTFYLDICTWEKIQPIVTYVKRNDPRIPSSKYRKKWSLPKHVWADILRAEIWKATKKPCTWLFKTVSIKAHQLIKCFGNCKECHAKIEISIIWPTNKIVACRCVLKNQDRSYKHKLSRKIKLSPMTRKAISVDLKNQSALSVHRSLIDSIMDEGDIEPVHLPKVGTLRQIKYEEKKAHYYDSNPTISLWIMAQTQPFSDLIRYIAIHPYVIVHYWLKEQENYYTKYIAKHKVILSLDATGSILKEFGPTYDMKITKHLFLYVCVIQTFQGKSSLPVSQMISESQTMETIVKWLSMWVAKKTPPHEVICDDSSALIGAAVKAFTNTKTTREYLDKSFQLLSENGSTSDQCYIRLDTNHFIKILYNLPCFKNVDPRVKYFYISCLREIKNSKEYEVIKNIVKDIVTLCLAKYIKSAKGDILKSEVALKRLKTLSVFQKKHDTSEALTENENKESCDSNSTRAPEFDNPDQFNEADDHVTHNSSTKSRVQWLVDYISSEKLINELEDEKFEDTANLYYMPSLVETLLRYVNQLPLWSNCMMNIYNSQNDTPTSYRKLF